VPVDRKVLAKIIRAEIGEVALDLLATEQP
jgi:hypothetical protein